MMMLDRSVTESTIGSGLDELGDDVIDDIMVMSRMMSAPSRHVGGVRTAWWPGWVRTGSDDPF